MLFKQLHVVPEKFETWLPTLCFWEFAYLSNEFWVVYCFMDFCLEGEKCMQILLIVRFADVFSQPACLTGDSLLCNSLNLSMVEGNSGRFSCDSVLCCCSHTLTWVSSFPKSRYPLISFSSRISMNLWFNHFIYNSGTVLCLLETKLQRKTVNK